MAVPTPARQWRFTALKSELILLVDGIVVDVVTVVERYSGVSFTLQCGKHFVTFATPNGADAAEVAVAANGAPVGVARSAVQLHVTANGLTLQQHQFLRWPDPVEPRRPEPQLGPWAARVFGPSLLSPTDGAVPATRAFARHVRVVCAFCHGSWEPQSLRALERLRACAAAGLTLDAAVVAVLVERSPGDFEAACDALPTDWRAVARSHTEKTLEHIGARGVPTLVVLDAASGRVVRGNAVVDVAAAGVDPASALRLWGVAEPSVWVRETRRRQSVAWRLKQRLDLHPEALVDAFRAADRDSSGALSLSEVGPALRSLGLPVSAKTVGLFSKHDDDRDRRLDFVEFCALCGDCRKVLQPDDPLRRRLLGVFTAASAAEAEGEDVDSVPVSAVSLGPDGHVATATGFLRMPALLRCLENVGVRTDLATVRGLTGRGDEDEFDFAEFASVAEHLAER